MKIKDIIYLSATLLSMKDVADYCLSENPKANEQTQKNVSTFTTLCNAIVNEISSCYLPLETAELVTPHNNKIEFSSLSKNIVRLIGVYDKNNVKLKTKVSTEYVEVFGDAHLIRYYYSAFNLDFGEEIGFNEAVLPKHVIAYGVIAEFCLTQQRFSEAIMWHNRFMQELQTISRPKNSNIKQRSFLR